MGIGFMKKNEEFFSGSQLVYPPVREIIALRRVGVHRLNLLLQKSGDLA